MKLAKSGAFERVATIADRDNFYQPAIDALNRTDLEIYKKKYEASKKGDTEKVKELEGLAEKVKEEKSRLHQQRNSKNYDKNEKPETEDELKYIKSLGDNKEKGYEKIVSLVEKEEVRLFNLPKEDETPKEEAPILKDKPKPEPKKEEKKPKEIKQEDKNSEIKPKETPRSEKVVGIDRNALENEFKAVRASKEPRKHYHEVGDEQNMMDDLQEKGLSYKEARAKTDEFFEKFDEEQRQKEQEKAQAKEAPKEKVEEQPKEKVETKPEPKVEPKPEPKVDPKPEPKVEPKPEPKPEPKFEQKEENKPLTIWEKQDLLRDLERTKDSLKEFVEVVKNTQESYEESTLTDKTPWDKKNDRESAEEAYNLVLNAISEIKETLPKEKTVSESEIGSVFERKEEIGSVFEKPKAPAGEIDRSRFKDLQYVLGQLKIELEDKYKPKIEPLKQERKLALSKPKLDAKERRKKLEQTYNETIGKEKEAEKQEAKKQEELKKQKQEQEKKDKQNKELKPKTAPEIGGPSGFGR